MLEIEMSFVDTLDFVRVDTGKLSNSEQPVTEVAMSDIGIIGRGPGGVYIGREIKVKAFQREKKSPLVTTDFNVKFFREDLIIDYNPKLCQVWEPFEIRTAD